MELNFKKITSITKIHKKTKVVNFSVKTNENYFANGILTHNCYMKRHKPEGLDIATNTEDILTAIDHHAWFATVEKPNQTHEKYITYDISCNEDFALHAKHHEWEKIFAFFRDHPVAMGSFATKYVNYNFLKFNPQGKIRIRFSLMPQKYADVLEPNTSTILGKTANISSFIKAGYDVHFNFSPVIVTDGWLDEYKKLFKLIDSWYIWYNHKITATDIKAEVIFLTHNVNKHLHNLDNQLPGEELLWNPDIQEAKISQYGGENIRYKHDLKAEYIRQWTELHDEIIPWNTIRYIF
jgi:spore photoproduct lyase